jgi:tRNA A-37 threonylcarbamoyl transferase component Bud32
MEPTQFGKYALLEHMGKGGVASVYRGSDNEDGSIVAVKVFESGPERPPEMSRKLRDREVRMLVSVRHPNIVKFRDAGQVDESYYYAMEFVENSLLKRMRSESRLSLVDKVLILRQTASALAAIHHKGIVHRDIKPGNILLDQDPSGAIHVKLTDLGIAKNVSETDIVREQMPTRVPGTLKYLSPEQIRLQAVDGRSDVFSLGVVAYEMLTGVPPFKAETTEEYLAANSHHQQMPAHRLTGDVPPFLGEMVERMLAKDREERYDSDTLSRDLELVQQHLVSGAPMVERTNAVSMFYVQPEEQLEAGGPAPRHVLAPASWALAFAIVLLGVILSAALWPGRGLPEASPRPPEPDEALTPAEALREAEAAAGAGRQWQALMLLRSVPAEGLSAGERSRLQILSGNAQEAAAEESYAAGSGMLAEGRAAEAAVVLAEMQDLFPLAERTRELADAVGRRQAPSPSDSQWQDALRSTYGLVNRGQYAEALEARRKLLANVAADPDKARTVSRTIGDLLDHWARRLSDTTPNADALERFFTAAQAQQDVAPGKPSPAQAAALRLKLANAYRDSDRSDLALQQYGLAISQGAPTVAAEAKQARDELEDLLASRPYEAADFAQQLARNGFEGGLWRELTDAGGSQRVSDGVLRLDASAGQGKAVVYRESARPVRNLGFTASVQVKVTDDLLRQPGSAQAGIAVVGMKGSICELAFDGASYVVSLGDKAGQVSAASSVRKAVGDEAQTWHALALRYDYNTGQLAAMLDDEVLRSYPMDLSDFRLRAFVTAAARSSAAADFKGITCRP